MLSAHQRTVDQWEAGLSIFCCLLAKSDVCIYIYVTIGIL